MYLRRRLILKVKGGYTIDVLTSRVTNNKIILVGYNGTINLGNGEDPQKLSFLVEIFTKLR